MTECYFVDLLSTWTMPYLELLENQKSRLISGMIW